MVRLSGRLTRALRTVIDSSPLAGLGPIEAARVLGVDKTLTSRLMSALRAGDPLVALSLLPGAAPLRQFVLAAREHGAGTRVVQAAERELRTFDHELQRTFGTRTRLDAVIADALPEARRRHLVGARQAVYRGIALIKGVSIDLASITWVVHPSRESPRHMDILVLAGFVGVRRLRPTARVRLGGRHERPRPGDGARLLTKFCRPAGLAIAASRERDFTFYEITTGSVRRDAAADVYLTEFLRAAAPRTHLAQKGRLGAFGDAVAHATRRLALSVLVHEDAWPGCDFSLCAYDTAVRGLVRLPDPERDTDRLLLDAEVVRSPADAEALRSFPVPNYATMLHHLTAPLGWDMEGARGRATFRMFSCEILYPLYGAQVLLVQE
jgi:hypothetical protein